MFRLLPPGGTWRVVQPYGTSVNYTWKSAGFVPGAYRFSVWARDASSAASYDAFDAFPYSLTTTPCSTANVTATPSTAAARGTSVTVTASASGCANPQFAFWIHPPGGTWTQIQPYSASATLVWDTTGHAPGVYRFSVWARDASSPGTSGTAPHTYDQFQAFDFSLT